MSFGRKKKNAQIYISNLSYQFPNNTDEDYLRQTGLFWLRNRVVRTNPHMLRVILVAPACPHTLANKPHSSMRVLIVIHGYPPFYMAGSEVYTYNLARELSKQNEVYVFHRIEDTSKPLYQTTDTHDGEVRIRYINNYEPGNAVFEDKYLNPRVDDAFREYVRAVKPDVVHIGHLSHLSIQIPVIAKREFGLPVVFTIHDFWMFCHRGQLINPDGWKICPLPNVGMCTRCAAFHYGKPDFQEEDIRRRDWHIERAIECIDVFLAPSHTLEKFYIDMGVPKEKVIYSKYGFNVSGIKAHRAPGQSGVTFGFAGRIILTKGVHLLCEAFSKTVGEAKLVIWGDTDSEYGRRLVADYDGGRIEFKGKYHNDNLQDVLNSYDVMVCPSIWLENAPLVIQEAQCAHIPVITSDKGGMAELVSDGIDGFTFRLGDAEDLRLKMQKVIDDPQLLKRLEQSRAKVRSMEDDARFCTERYKDMGRVPIRYPHMTSPWRVTFITNPDKCNLHCKMCDTFSDSNRHRLSESSRPEMDFRVIEKTIRQLTPLGLKEVIPSTMGEPLLYRHFGRLLELCKESGLKMNITTNGTFPGGVEKWADPLIDVASDIKFSLNGIAPAVNESIMCGADTAKQLSNIDYYIGRRNAVGSHSTVTLQCTFMKSNLDELPRIVEWAIGHGVDRVKGHHVWKTSDALEGETLRTRESAHLWNEVCAKCSRLADGRIRLENFEPLSAEAPDEDGDDTFCPFVGQELWIEYDGTYQVCCCPSEERKSLGDFGKFGEKSPIEMWESMEYRNFINNWGSNDNCRRCNMRRKRG